MKTQALENLSPMICRRPKSGVVVFSEQVDCFAAAAAGERDVPEYHGGRCLSILRDAAQQPDVALHPYKAALSMWDVAALAV
jgi:hypothetical protein